LLNFIYFCSCHEKWTKVGQILSGTLTIFHGIFYETFAKKPLFGFNEILFRFII
jgi:hypothetical protein